MPSPGPGLIKLQQLAEEGLDYLDGLEVCGLADLPRNARAWRLGNINFRLFILRAQKASIAGAKADPRTLAMLGKHYLDQGKDPGEDVDVELSFDGE